MEVGAVSCGSRHTAAVTRECPAGGGGPAAPVLGAMPADGHCPVAGDGELYTWGWGKRGFCSVLARPVLVVALLLCLLAVNALFGVLPLSCLPTG